MSSLNLAGHPWRSTEPGVFRRKFGGTELGFYWDTVFNGVAITIEHVELEAEPALAGALFAKKNIERTWVRLKRRFPLLGASVDELPGSETVEFVVDDRRLAAVQPGEVVYADVAAEEGIMQLGEKLQNGEPTLSNAVVAQLVVACPQTMPYTLHAFVVVAHYITDGISIMALMREFCQELASLSDTDDVDGPPLAERLKALVPLEDLAPSTSLSLPHRRWRLAAGRVILALRQAKLTGGHTLPMLPRIAPGTPAQSLTLSLRLPPALSQHIIRTCRAHGITVGNALPVLAQLAHARVLHRRRALAPPAIEEAGASSDPQKVLISDKEWAYRRAQPMYFAGPINLRPYLDRDWFSRGGSTDLCLAISFYSCVLPLMPSPSPPPSVPALTDCPATSSTLSKTEHALARWFEGERDPHAKIDESENSVEHGRWRESTRETPTRIGKGRNRPSAPVHSLARWLEGPRDPYAQVDEAENSFPSEQSSASPYALERWLDSPSPRNPHDLLSELSLQPSTSASTLSSPPLPPAPSFASLLSFTRFLHRARLVRTQSVAQLRHPLLNELHAARTIDRIARARTAAFMWRARASTNESATVGGGVGGPTNTTSFGGCVFSNGGATLGNLDILFPSSYPLPPNNSDPTHTQTPVRLRVRSSALRLRCRPGELYLGASSAHGRLALFCHADVRTYDESVVREWVGEVRDAAIFYLGGGAARERPEGDESGLWSGLRELEGEGTQLRARL